MIGAAPPSTNDNVNYVHVATHRKLGGDPRAESLWPQVKSLYNLYAKRLFQAGGPAPYGFAASDHDVLEKNADYLSLAHFKQFRADVLSAAGGNCASCNNVSASELDHYAPKGYFGEYSLLSLNLTPICSPCNKKKSNRYVGPLGGRRYVHPYFDQLPATEPFVDCEVSVGATVSTTFAIAAPASTPHELVVILKQHFDDLGLGAMYNGEATNEMMGRLGSFYSYFNSGGPARLASYLDLDGRSMAARFGVNHWLPLTLRALAASVDFCDQGFAALGPDPLA